MPQHKKEFAVIGLGIFGSAVALTLEAEGHYVLGIDQDIDIVQSLSAELTHVVALDAADEVALRNIGITDFGTVIVAIGTDFESSLLITVALKNLGVARVICKTISRRQGEILRKVGADRVVLPEYETGQRLAEELLNPGILERFHLGPGYSIAELGVPKRFCNQSLAQSDLRRVHGLNVLLIKRGDQLMTAPRAETILLDGDLIVVLAGDDKIAALSAQGPQ